jgi:uncharacterized protein YbjT (DUF2867 family)
MPDKIENKIALVFGASGLVGNEVVKQLILSEHYDKIKIFVRQKTGLNHPKLTEVLNNLENPENIAEEIAGNDLFCCLGTTIKKAGSKEAFEQVDLHLPMAIAKIALQNNVNQYIVVSSIGANADSGSFYLRTKGKMEKGIQSFSFEKICILRPSILLGKRKEKRFGESAGKILSKVFSFLFVGQLKKYKGIQAKLVAKAMIILANSDNTRIILESDEIAKIAEKSVKP